MSALLQVFARFGGSVLFLLLEGICLYLIVTYNQQQQIIFLNTSNKVTGAVAARYDYVADYIGLKKQIETLRNENIQLRSQLDNAYYEWSLRRDTIAGDSLIQGYTYIPANVVSKNLLGRTNTFTLDKGSKQGVKTGQGVIGPKGIVGMVVGVSEYYCKVMTILHQQSYISASIRGSNYYGSLMWDGEDSRIHTLDAIPKHAVVNVGDTVQTSGYSDKFPKGILIGRVVYNELNKTGDRRIVKVELFNELATQQTAYIVNNLMAEDLKKLEGIGNE